MTKTPNHNYNAPSKGTEDWHVPLNENFTQLDIDVEIRDVEANVGNHEPKQNAKFEATDTGAVYYGNGTSWNLADRKLNSLSVGEVATRSQVPDAIVYDDSSMYRAVGKTGSIASGNDAGQVIQAAVDAAGVGGAIHISSGTFSCDSGIQLHESQWLSGAGMYQTILKATSNIPGHLIQATDDDSSSREEFLRISEMTIDMDNQGFSAIFWFVAQDCIVERINAINAGARDGTSAGGILLRNSFGNDGHDHWIINNRAENCSNVSIDCGAGGTDPSRAIVYGNKIFNPDGDQMFTHGISVENVDNSTVANNTCIENDGNGPRWSPAINVNAASHTTVVGNTIENVVNGIHTANGPAVGNVYSANTIYNFTGAGVRIQSSGAGDPIDNLIIGNTFDANQNDATGVLIRGGCHADVINNVFRLFRGSGAVGIGTNNESPAKPVNIIGNQFVRHQDGVAFSPGKSGAQSGCIIANNRTERRGAANALSTPTVSIPEDGAMVVGNSFGYKDGNDFATTVKITGSDVMFTNNHVRGGADAVETGSTGPVYIFNNVIEEGDISLGSTIDIVRGNFGTEGTETILASPTNYDVGAPRSGTYTGDGTQNRTIQTAINPEYVVVEGSDGTKYDVHTQWGSGYQFTDPAGELSLVDGGFEVGDGGGDANPNTDTESYTFYAR